MHPFFPSQDPSSNPGPRGRLAARLGALAFSLAALAPGAAWADRIVRTDGKVFDGAVVSQTATEVVIRTSAGTLSVPRSQVARIMSSDTDSDEVEADRARDRGDLAAAESGYRLALANTGGRSADAKARIEKKLASLLATQQQATMQRAAQRFNEARALASQGRLDEAQQSVDAALSRLSSDAAATSAARRLLSEIHMAKAARAADRLDALGQESELKAAIDSDPSHYRPYLSYGELLLKNSTTEDAGLQAIIDGINWGAGQLSEAELVKYHYLVGDRYFQRKEYEAAATNFIQALRAKGKYPAYADSLDRAVKSYVKLSEANRSGDFGKTITTLNEALALDKNNKDAHFLLGSIYLDQGKLDDAIAQLEQTARIDPTYKSVHRNLARAYLAKKDYDEALKHLKAELDLDPTAYDILVDRAATYILLAKYDEARKDLTVAIDAKGDQYNAYLKLAELNIAQEKYDEARQNLAKVLALKKEAVEAYVQMGNVLVREKNFPDARKWFNEVIGYLVKRGGLSLEYKQLLAEAHTQIGAMDLDQESPRQAEASFLEALAVLPDYANALDKIGDVRKKLGDETKNREGKEAAQPFYNEAERSYKRAISVDPRNADHYLALAILYHQTLRAPEKALPNYMMYRQLGGRNKTEVGKWIIECGGNPEQAGVTMAEVAAAKASEAKAGDAATSGAAAGAPPGIVPAAGAVTTGTATVASGAAATSAPVTIAPMPPGA